MPESTYIGSTRLNRLSRRLRYATLGRLLVDYNDYRETVLLAGTGRSGTTWVGNIINYANTYRLMFEPFHSIEVELVSHFKYRQYLRPDNRDTRFLEPAKAIVSGRVRNPWIDAFNRKVIAKKRLIKDVRANHLLKWIKTNFPEIPVILLLRHPCAVASSKLKLDWNTHLEDFLSQDELMEDFLAPFEPHIENANTVFDKHIFLWCIENYVPLRQFKAGEIHLAFYEHFCTRPAVEVERLFSFLGETYDAEVFNVVKKPSALGRKESAIVSDEGLTDSWRKYLTGEQIHRAVEILTLFGLQRIYSEDSMPLVSDQRGLLPLPTSTGCV